MRALGIFLLIAGPVFSGEYAVLASGARLHVDRHEVDGNKVRLYQDGGFVEIEAASVSEYEKEDAVAAPAASLVLTAPPSPAPAPVSPPASPVALADAA